MRLFKIEFLKVKSDLTLLGFGLAYTLMIPVVLFLIGKFRLGTDWIELNTSIIFEFPYNWEIIPYIASWFNLILAIGIISYVSSEHSNKMVRKTFIDGLTRKELYLGKLITVISLSLLCTIYLFVLITAFGIIYYDSYSSEAILNFKPLLLYFFQTLCYFSIAMLFATWIKNATTTILIFIGYYFLEFLLSIPINKSYEVFLPFDAFSEIVPTPNYQEFIQQDNSFWEAKYKYELVPYVSFVYLVLMQVSTFLLYKLRRL